MHKFVVALMLLGLSGGVSAGQVSAVVLSFLENEQGTDAYRTRTIVTDRYIRMDDGEDSGDYLIFDREKNFISSVTHEDETVFEIPFREVDSQTAPMEFRRRESLMPDNSAPPVGGQVPQSMQLYVNDKRCYEAVVVPGLFDDVVEGLRSFKQVLAGEQAKILAQLPYEAMDGCDLALHTFYPQWSLSSGLAIQEWDESLQKGRMLIDMQADVALDSNLFELPDHYKRYQTP